MISNRLDDRGQISAEYLLLIVVILVILGSVTIPLITDSVRASNDISWTSDAKIAVESIADAVNVVYANGPGAKRTLNIHVPRDGMSFQNNTNNIQLTAQLSDQNKIVNADINYPISITQPTLQSDTPYNVQVEWVRGNSFINVDVTAA